MNQPDWLKSILSRFDGIDAKLAKPAESAELQTRLTTAEDSVKTLTTSLAERDASILSLTSDLEKAQNEVNTSGAKVKSLTEELATEKNRAMEAIAGQSLPHDKLPEAEVTPGSKGESAFKTYERLTKEGKHSEAAKFYAANADKIIATRNLK